jgi:signal transduction histidine kinase/phage shock protein PspC (stress-responsive transcriptional regulator)
MMVPMATTYRPRRAYRDTEDRYLGGVASGLAGHLGLATGRVRLAFVALAVLGGFGVVWYAGLWLMLPVRDAEAPSNEPPGMSAATRRGMRAGRSSRRGPDVAVVVSLLVCGAGVLALLQTLGLGLKTQLFWPALVGAGGLVLVWWRSDETSRSAWLTNSLGWKTWLRTLAGAALVGGAIWLAIFQSGVRGAVGTAIATLVLAAIGVVLVLGPWLLRTNRALRFERAERIRSQERADVAAHLHDSVLQTLALIQRRADEPQAVAQLARTQERELRRWLFEASEPGERTLANAVKDVAAHVEDERGIVVQTVVVGDVAVGDRYQPVVGATREALVNAAKHSGVQRVDLYVEVVSGGEAGSDGVEIFVRDRGSGFDPDSVPADRQGLRGSVIDRMARYGGRADVRSKPGDGTEVRLWMPADPRVGGSSVRTQEDGHG